MNTIEVVKEVLIRFGTAWILWLLAGLTLIAILIVVERFLLFRSASGDLESLARALDEKLATKRFDQALAYLKNSPTVAASIASAGLKLAHLGPKAAEKAMQGATALERQRLEKRLAYLGTVGNNAPFVGLFGTVIGVIESFEHLGTGGGGQAGQAASQAVMASIAEALVTTAIGILAALPAVALYNYLMRRVTAILAGTEALSSLVLAYLEAETPAAPLREPEPTRPAPLALAPKEV
jgi:biopolymer transport protein ExbB